MRVSKVIRDDADGYTIIAERVSGGGVQVYEEWIGYNDLDLELKITKGGALLGVLYEGDVLASMILRPEDLVIYDLDGE